MSGSGENAYISDCRERSQLAQVIVSPAPNDLHEPIRALSRSVACGYTRFLRRSAHAVIHDYREKLSYASCKYLAGSQLTGEEPAGENRSCMLGWSACLFSGVAQKITARFHHSIGDCSRGETAWWAHARDPGSHE